MWPIEWNPSLVLQHTAMDATHQEFVALLNRLAQATQENAAAVLDEFIAHTEAHFALERKWMEETHFPPQQCHVREHEGVLEVAREVRKRVAAGETRFAQVLAKATAEWFENHAASMDAVLAMYLNQEPHASAVGCGSPACAQQAEGQ